MRDDNSPRLFCSPLPHGQSRIVRPQRPPAHENSVNLCSQSPCVKTRGRGGYPSSLTRWCRESPIETHAAFGDDERTLGADPFVVSFIEDRTVVGQHARANPDRSSMK